MSYTKHLYAAKSNKRNNQSWLLSQGGIRGKEANEKTNQWRRERNPQVIEVRIELIAAAPLLLRMNKYTHNLCYCADPACILSMNVLYSQKF